ncbi:MAG TPA: DUF6644 family protein [Bryobacteraceae bacterium]|nr:DUF6644 family protein [Bryobacteraceae bacterium]
MSLLPLLNWLQNTGWATSLKESTLMFPFVEGSHLLALSFSVGMVMVLDLRLLRLCLRDKPAALVMREVMPWSLAGFAVMLGTGFLLFASQAVSAWTNPFFRVKMILLALSGLNALYYQVRYYPRMADWDREGTPAGVRAIAILSLIFWIGVIACGRTMAYEL